MRSRSGTPGPGRDATSAACRYLEAFASAKNHPAPSRALSRLQATPAAGGPLWGLRSQYFGQLNDRCRLKVREWWDFWGAGSRNMQRKNSVCLTILFLDFWMRSIESSALPARQPSPKCSAPETRPSRVLSVIFQGCKKANQEETGMAPIAKPTVPGANTAGHVTACVASRAKLPRAGAPPCSPIFVYPKHADAMPSAQGRVALQSLCLPFTTCADVASRGVRDKNALCIATLTCLPAPAPAPVRRTRPPNYRARSMLLLDPSF